MMQTLPPALRRLGFLVLVLFVAGCDAVATGPEPITLQEKTVTFRFEFSSDALQMGQAFEVASTAAIDLGPQLDNFSKDDVLQATATKVEAHLRQPLAADLSVLREASFQVTGDGQVATVASRAGFPATDVQTLTLAGGQDLGSFVRMPSFRARMRVEPATLTPNEDYVLEVRLSLRIQVEGL